ncbi:MAG: hypothetical protein AAF721_05645, partial [Myxococcota bacterium]
MRESPLEAFEGACGGRYDGPMPTAANLNACFVAGRRVHPDVDVTEPEFAAALGAAVVAGSDWASVDAGEVFVAAGCAHGRREALHNFETLYLSGLPRVLARLGLDDAAVADAIQAAREKLLVAPPSGGPIRVVRYAGRGQLKALVRVVATRAAVDIQRRAVRQQEVPAEHLSAVLIASTDPEALAAGADKADTFRAAFERAVAELPAADRMALRLYVLQGVGIDGVAKAWGIH